MPLLLVLLFLFVTAGWSLPPSLWGAVPVLIGVGLLVSGLLGVVATLRQPGLTTGLSSLLIAFLGVVVCVFGLGMAGRPDVADACLNWLKDIDDSVALAMGLIIGLVLTAFTRRQS